MLIHRTQDGFGSPLSRVGTLQLRRNHRLHKKQQQGPTTPFSLTTQTDVGIMYFEYHIDSIDFENLLEDAKQFDPNNRTEFDQTVSFLMLLVCLMEPVQKQQMKEPLVKSYTPSFN